MTMLPTRDQIERAAYDRWLRRHRAHGHDRTDWIGAERELTYLLTYETVVEHSVDSSHPSIIGADRVRRCRFCERTARNATFSASRPVVQGGADSSFSSSRICDECEEDCRAPLDPHVAGFWNSLGADADTDLVRPRHLDLMAVFKSLVTSALLIMPEAELAYFTDTVEWVNNPDHSYDAGLFAGSDCHIYRAPFLHERSWISLARRIDDQSPFPYMLFFVCTRGLIVQISVPLSVCDHDLDGRSSRMPVRSLTGGEGSRFREASATVLRLVDAPARTRKERRRELVLS